MNKLLSCRYNMDTNRVEARFEDETTLAIDCIAIEDEYGNTPAQRAELDWLLYNKPLEYAQMVLGGEIEHYLSLGCDHGRMENSMKRLIAGFLSVCVAVSLLMTGCSSGGTGNVSQTDGSVTITIWHDKEDEVAQALQAELDTLAPDIVVKLEKKDGLTDSLKMVGNDPKSAPDMYFFAHDKIGVYAEATQEKKKESMTSLQSALLVR